MLLEIREKAQGWFAWLIVAFITIPFALWGIQSYLQVRSETPVATVDDIEITQPELAQRFRLYQERLREQLGDAYRPELFDESQLKHQALQQLINEAVLKKNAERWKMRISDDYVRESIRAMPYFQVDGQFNLQAYRTVLRNQALPERAFEEKVRQSLMQDQFKLAFVHSALITETDFNDYYRLKEQRRTIEYILIKGQSLLNDDQPDEASIEDYYQKNRQNYIQPERVRLAYILLSTQSLSDQIPFDDHVLRDYYQQHREEFQAPEERKVRHILIAGQDEKAKQKAQSIYQQLQKGADFAQLARQYSEDPGSKEQGGDLGWISPGMMVKPFEEAVYRLKLNQISSPIQTEFGYHIIQLTAIKNSQPEDEFQQLKPKIEQAYRRNEAEKILFDKAEKLADISYENPDSLEPAADALGLEIKQTDWLDRRGGSGLFALPKVINAAFSEDVLNEGHNSELLELDEDQMIVLRVIDHEEEHIPPLEKIRSQLIKDMQREKAAQLATEKGESLLKQLEQDQDWSKLAEKWPIKKPGAIKRNDFSIPPQLSRLVFSLPRPQQKQRQFGGTALDQDYAIVALSKVEDGQPDQLKEEQRKKMIQSLSWQKGQKQFELLLQALKQRAKIQINE